MPLLVGHHHRWKGLTSHVRDAFGALVRGVQEEAHDTTETHPDQLQCLGAIQLCKSICSSWGT